MKLRISLDAGVRWIFDWNSRLSRKRYEIGTDPINIKHPVALSPSAELLVKPATLGPSWSVQSDGQTGGRRKNGNFRPKSPFGKTIARAMNTHLAGSWDNSGLMMSDWIFCVYNYAARDKKWCHFSSCAFFPWFYRASACRQRNLYLPFSSRSSVCVWYVSPSVTLW